MGDDFWEACLDFSIGPLVVAVGMFIAIVDVFVFDADRFVVRTVS